MKHCICVKLEWSDPYRELPTSRWRTYTISSRQFYLVYSQTALNMAEVCLLYNPFNMRVIFNQGTSGYSLNSLRLVCVCDQAELTIPAELWARSSARAHRGYLHPSPGSYPGGTGSPGGARRLCFNCLLPIRRPAGVRTDLGLVLYPVRRLLELSDLPNDVANLREHRPEICPF